MNKLPQGRTGLAPRKRRCLRTAIFVVGLACAMPAFGVTPSTDAAIGKALSSGGPGRINVIVRSSKDLTDREVAKFGGYVYRHLPIIHSTAVNLPKKNLNAFLSTNGVTHASADLSVKKHDEFTVASSEAASAWQQYSASGQNVGIAILDSGVRANDDFKDPVTGANRLVASANFSPDTESADDACGHGTHVAGIAAGSATGSTGPQYSRSVFGIAPRSKIVNVRILDSEGGGTVSQTIAGLQWVIANKSAYNIRVVNLSLGHAVGESYTTDPLCQAVEAVWGNGIVVVCTAGNDGRLNATTTAGADNDGYGTNYASIESPGNDPYVITVGAMRSNDGTRAHDSIATYSSRGPSRLDFVLKPDIVAPGNKIVSVLASGGFLDQNYAATNGVPWSYYCVSAKPGLSNQYFVLSGTSMAAPVVAGAAALLIEKQPNIDPNTVKARLMLSADHWTAPNGLVDVFSYGAGYLNIPAALQSSVVVDQPATSPTVVRDPDGTLYIDLSHALWTRSLGSTETIWATDTTSGGTTTGSGTSSGTITDPGRAMWGRAFWGDSACSMQSTVFSDLSRVAIKGD